jgi:hypothetical protein
VRSDEELQETGACMKRFDVVDWLFLAGGFVLGVGLVRLFLLDTIEQIAFRLFFEALGNGGSGFSGSQILQSTTFWKCLVGGGVCALLAAFLVAPKLKTQTPQ